jgi:sec-independent protein translocase protein TatB
MGIIKRHAAEFRAQFDEAMREAELEQLKKEVEGVGSTAEAQMRAAEQSLGAELGDAMGSIDAPRQAAAGDGAPEPAAAQQGEPMLPEAEAVAPTEPKGNGEHDREGSVEAAPTEPQAVGNGEHDGKGSVDVAPREDGPVPAARAPEKSGA